MTKIIKPSIIEFINYGALNDKFISNLKKKKINKVIFTDFCIDHPPNIKKIEKFAEILIMDHHQFVKNFNSKKTVFYHSGGHCAAYICYSLFNSHKEVKKLDWLAALASNADWEYFKNKSWMKKIYRKYGDKFNINNPRKGKLWNIIENVNYTLIYLRENPKKGFLLIGNNLDSMKKFKKYSTKIRKELKRNIKKFNKQKQKINGGWFYQFKSKYSIDTLLATEVSTEDYSKIFLIIRKKPREYRVSARRQDRKMSLPKLLQKLTKNFQNSSAGGHNPSAGCNFPRKYMKEFKRRLKNINPEEFKVK